MSSKLYKLMARSLNFDLFLGSTSQHDLIISHLHKHHELRLSFLREFAIHFIGAGDIGGSLQSVSRMKLREQSHGWHSSVGNSSTGEHLPTCYPIRPLVERRFEQHK